MEKLRGKLKDRLTGRFFGFDANTLLESEDIPNERKRTTEANFCEVLMRSVSYMERWFDFTENNVVRVLQHLSLNTLPTFQQLVSICTALHTAASNMDALYDEFFSSRTGICCTYGGK